ncbi:MAG: GNAT family N-acetyltransferase [Candidatus Omnitrophica bacterium]|nr:GNAT family N-acetyltransferase [Candidatus Omnitrophota bacterium]
MEIKNLEEKDFEKIMRFLEDVYGHSFNSFCIRYPHVWKKEKLDYQNILVIEENENILSLVRIFPLTLIQKDLKIKLGGIGAVSTKYEERGKGYMSTLMNYAIKKMEDEGYPLSILWGDRHRYKNFGYEIGGKLVLLNITKRGLEKKKVKSVEAKRYLGEKEILNKIIEVYNEKRYRIERDYDYFQLIYTKFGTSLYYSEDNGKFGYVVAGSTESSGLEIRVYEVGGDEYLIVGILKYLCDRFGKNSFILEYGSFEDIPDIIVDCSSYWRVEPCGMIKIIDLKKTIETYKSVIEDKLSEEDEVLFEIEGKSRVGIRKEKGKLKFIEESENIVKLNEEEMVRLFFDFSGKGIKIDGKAGKLVEKFLPFDLFFPLIDHI